MGQNCCQKAQPFQQTSEYVPESNNLSNEEITTDLPKQNIIKKKKSVMFIEENLEEIEIEKI